MDKLIFFKSEELKSIFDKKDCEKISNYLNKKFSSFLENETFEMIAGQKNDQVQITLILRKDDDSFFYPIESVFVYDESYEKDDRPTAEEIAFVMLDYLTVYFEEFLSEERRVFLPINWSVHQTDEFTFFLRGFTRNLKLERDADTILAKHGHGVHSIEPISFET